MKYTHLQLFWTCLKILIFDNDVDIFSFFFFFFLITWIQKVTWIKKNRSILNVFRD